MPRSVAGPLIPFINDYASYLNDQGYCHQWFLRKTGLIIQFSRWLCQKRISVNNLTLRHAAAFLQAHSRWPGDPKTLKDFLRWLQTKGAVSSNALESCRKSDVDLLADEYSEYLSHERGLALTSIEAYASIARKFLAYTCPRGRSQINSLSATEICGFIQAQANRHWGPKWLGLLATAERSFLRFAQYKGYINKPLANAVPTVAGWSMVSIPRALPLKSIRRVLAQSKRRSTTDGFRERAILMLLARLGLRAREVMLLGLDDIDWTNSCIYVSGKGGEERPFPLPKDVGDAIARYLQLGRPESQCRRVFLRTHAPFLGLAKSSAISQVVCRALHRAGIESTTYGAHQFRHSLATNLLRKGATLTEIGQVLRHKNPNTTRLYTKIDLDALRKVALPWPEKPL